MNKILFSADPDINYVFHMLSVAKCGYDNAYGEKYRGRYDSADMKCIKDHEFHLTVRGGEHCGDWYGPMVCEPARSGLTAKQYYIVNVKHFFTRYGNQFLTRFGKQFFTSFGNEFFTSFGNQFFTSYGR